MINSENNDNGNRLSDANNVCISIKTAANGVVVSGYQEGHEYDGKKEQYVYTTIEKALAEIPSLIDVLKKKTYPKDSSNRGQEVEMED
jgi:hypothetical protein